MAPTVDQDLSPEPAEDEFDAGLRAALEADQQAQALRTQVARLQKLLTDARAASEAPEPPGYIQGSGPFGTSPKRNPAWESWDEDKAKADRQLREFQDSTKGPGKELQDALNALGKREAAVTKDYGKTQQQVPKAPARATINGALHERQPDGTWKPVETAAPSTIAPGAGTDPRLAGKPRGTTIRQDVETGLDGNKYTVEYYYSPTGTKQGLASDKEHPPVPVGGAFGTDPTAALDLQTAQFKLQQAQQQLAAENDPLKKAQLQLAVDQARFTLQQAQATAPVDLATAQTNLAIAQQRLEEATSPEAKETARLALEQARVALETSRQGLARGNAPQVVPTDTTSPVITTRDPNTGAISTQPNPAYQGPTFADATAAYNAQVPRLQQAARTERDRLLELQRSGAISEADAEKQFTQWFGQNVETPLAGYRTAAEEAQRKEQRENATAQRAEDARAELLNRQREQLGLEAGQQARTELIGLAPQVRTPQFLEQMGQQVARMSARAGAPNAEAAANLPRGSTFTADTFNPANFQGVIPDLDAYAKQATDRALAAISPSVAARIGAPLPTLPTGPTLQAMLAQTRYRGPLSGLPSAASGLVPTPGMNQALDIGGGRARTPYGPGGNVYLDWDLPR